MKLREHFKTYIYILHFKVFFACLARMHVIVACKLTRDIIYCYQNEIQKNNVKLREHFKTDISSILKVRFGFSLLFLSLLPPVQLNLF